MNNREMYMKGVNDKKLIFLKLKTKPFCKEQ